MTTMDLFYADPAGVDVVHFDARYSTAMPRFTDTFADRSTVPRSLSYAGYTMSQGTSLQIVAFPAASSPITPSGDFTVLIPIRLAYATLGAGDRLALKCLNLQTQIQYNANGNILQFYGETQPSVPLPDNASRWYNNYHVLSLVYTASTNKGKTYMHYYTTDPNVVSSVSPPEATIAPYVPSRQELSFEWKGSSQPLGSVNIRPATMFPSALSEAVLTAAAKKLLNVYDGFVEFMFTVASVGTGHLDLAGAKIDGVIIIEASGIFIPLSTTLYYSYNASNGPVYELLPITVGQQLFKIRVPRKSVTVLELLINNANRNPGYQITRVDTGATVLTTSPVGGSGSQVRVSYSLNIV